MLKYLPKFVVIITDDNSKNRCVYIIFTDAVRIIGFVVLIIIIVVVVVVIIIIIIVYYITILLYY